MPEKPRIVNARMSSIKVDGEFVPGLKSITYKIFRDRVDIHAIGNAQRTDVLLGEAFVAGVLTVRAQFVKFDQLLCNGEKFQLVVNMKQGGEDIGLLAFDDCYLESVEFGMTSNGEAISSYTFTGSRIRMEQAGEEFEFAGPDAAR